MSAPTIAVESSTRTESSAPRVFPQLDGMRALAVLIVLLHHMEEVKVPSPVAYIRSLGWIGVDAFFVLSGFLITKILLSSKPGWRAFRLFVIRRTLRTWPLYFTVLLMLYLLQRTSTVGADNHWLQHVFFLQNYAPAFVTRSLAPTWSLCVEEHFYIVWPLLVFCIPRRALQWVLLLIFAALPMLRYWGLHHAFTYTQLYTESQFHLDGLIAGSLVALLLARNRISPQLMNYAGYACLIVGTATAFLGFRHSWYVIYGHNVVFGYTSLAIAFSGLLMLLLRGESTLIARAFSIAPMRYCGRISYGIYLLHGGLYSLLARVPFHRLFGDVAESPMFVIVVRAGITIGLAALSYEYFEAPILRLKDRFR